MSDQTTGRNWWVEDDARIGGVVIRLSGHVDTQTIREAVSELARLLREYGAPTKVVADLFEVTSFEPKAPVVAVQVAFPVARLIDEVEIIAHQIPVRIAAVSAAHLLGLKCRVRRHR